ncbi:hypothetical protein [Aurantiacibacter sediminis]|uniref:Uncharacterized protein n=1 Tax=Aurantiacibacter sediminis TaxID=2793064 RepID=A0ABS0N221_9SPHN|nr:hypothetical protein [Aurantiacibacter sediminis]MBH5321074.1 hypothetical protein [Aurantiacibacter sediminis]
MKTAIATTLFAASVTCFGLAACSEQTENDAARTADMAAEDAAANAEVAGEAIEEGAIDASEAVAEGASNLADELREGDEEEPGPAPITGDNIQE